MPWKARPPKVNFFHFPDALAEGFFLPRLALVQHVSARPASGGRGPDVRRKFPRHVSKFYIPGKATLTFHYHHRRRSPTSHQPPATSHLAPFTTHHLSSTTRHPSPSLITHRSVSQQSAAFRYHLIIFTTIILTCHPSITSYQPLVVIHSSVLTDHPSLITHHSSLTTHHSLASRQ